MTAADIHADDYALSVNTSLDILSCIRKERLNSVSILPNMSCFDDCLKLWKQEMQNAKAEGKKPPKISVHLNFIEGRSLSSPDGLRDLVDSEGYFCNSWTRLLGFSFSPRRAGIREQLKTEIRAQIERVRTSYSLNPPLRIDSHQHTHMIPVIFDALMDVIMEDGYSVEYIRDCRDLLSPYLCRLSLLRTLRPVNMVKVLVLNLLSLRAERRLKKYGMDAMYLCGVFMSGRMDRERVERLYPSIHKIARKKGRSLEILFHPGSMLPEEAGKDFPDRNAVDSFYLSENRAVEREAVMNLHVLY